MFNYLFTRFPAFYEVVYFNGFFQIFRVLYDYTFGLVPFAMLYVLIILVIYMIIQFSKHVFLKEKSIFQYFKKLLFSISSFLGGFVFLFYTLWGYNYKQVNISERLSFERVEVDTLVLMEEAITFTKKLNALRTLISNDSGSLTFTHLDKDLETNIRVNLEQILNSWDIPTNGRVRVRKLMPKGVLLRISTAGVYIPFVLEGHIDAGLHPIQYPFTMAHEMSHGYGIADEGTCNFIGFLVCMNSESEFMQYSASVSYWRYLVNNLNKYAPHSYNIVVRELDQNVKEDLKNIRIQMDKYPDVLPQIRDVFYDQYLKSHGVKGGLSNYSTVVRLVLEWKNSNHNQSLKSSIYNTIKTVD